MKEILLRLLTLVALVPILASCYVPDDFVCEIRVAKSGDYSLIYNGTLTWAPLVMDIHDKKVTDAQITETETSLTSELKRIPEFTQVTPLSPGKFKVKFQRNGTFTGPTEVDFPRSGAAVISMRLKLDGTLQISSTAKPKMTELQKLDEAGITSHGRLRVLTNIDVSKMKTNTESADHLLPGYPGWHYIDWMISSLAQPAPVLIAQLFPPGTLKDPNAKP